MNNIRNQKFGKPTREIGNVNHENSETNGGNKLYRETLDSDLLITIHYVFYIPSSSLRGTANGI